MLLPIHYTSVWHKIFNVTFLISLYVTFLLLDLPPIDKMVKEEIQDSGITFI